MHEKRPIRFRFDAHGLGDCVHAVTVLQLYLRAGYDVAIQVESNKRWLWEAAGIPIYDGPDQLPLHPYYYPGEFHNLNAPDCTASKIAHFVLGVAETVLPRLGTPEEIWQQICGTQLDIRPKICPEAHAIAQRFVKGLPRPIFAIHSRGTNWSAEKSIPDGTAFEAIMNLLRQTSGSVIVLDFDARAPSVAGHPRCRAILPDSGIHALDQIAALLTRLDMLIGIDSGPFHLARLIPGLKSLGVFRLIAAPRCCIPSQSTTYLVPGRDHMHWKHRQTDFQQDNLAAPEWTFQEYCGDNPTAREIADTAIDLLLSPITPHAWREEKTAEMNNPDPGLFLYRRLGYDERPLALLDDWTIGTGSAGCERAWRLDAESKNLTIFGDGSSETCKLLRHDNGRIYRGRWNNHERMPIDLIRLPEVARDGNLWDGQVRIVPPELARMLFPGYDPEWGHPVGTRGNGTAWVLDPVVQRSDLDACGIDHEDWIYKHLDVPAGSVCLDLASFIGTNAVWWALRGATVIACEPMPRSRDLLHKNIQLNQLGEHITVIPKAFGAVLGQMRMNSELHYASFIGDTGDIEVDVTTIDHELLPELQRLDIIKLDVEGAECEVIEGAVKTLLRFRPKLIIEVHSHMDHRHENGTILTRQMKDLDYSIQRIWTNSPSYYYISCTPN